MEVATPNRSRWLTELGATILLFYVSDLGRRDRKNLVQRDYIAERGHNLLKTKLAGEGIPVWGVTLWYDWLYTFKFNELERLVIQSVQNSVQSEDARS